MTTKQQVNLDIYQKSPRLLTKPMEHALEPGGGLHPILAAVTQDDRLRLDIRDRRFNVYYKGGTLLLVDGRKSPWEMRFDKKYFKNGSLELPPLPTQYSTSDESREWVEAFPALISGMDEWWTKHPKGERRHCQDMAAANSARVGPPPADYLVLDLEYQWAQRRFDMVVAKRRPTEDDLLGWVEPDFTFVEVKCDYGSCTGTFGLGNHARDYCDIITALDGRRVQEIKHEYENVIAQKKRLGLLYKTLPFERFSAVVPELLIVLINLDLENPLITKSLTDVSKVSEEFGIATRIHFMLLKSPDYMMKRQRCCMSETTQQPSLDEVP